MWLSLSRHWDGLTGFMPGDNVLLSREPNFSSSHLQFFYAPRSKMFTFSSVTGSSQCDLPRSYPNQCWRATWVNVVPVRSSLGLCSVQQAEGPVCFQEPYMLWTGITSAWTWWFKKQAPMALLSICFRFQRENPSLSSLFFLRHGYPNEWKIEESVCHCLGFSWDCQYPQPTFSPTQLSNSTSKTLCAVLVHTHRWTHMHSKGTHFSHTCSCTHIHTQPHIHAHTLSHKQPDTLTPHTYCTLWVIRCQGFLQSHSMNWGTTQHSTQHSAHGTPE